MKKILFIFALLATTLVAFAQETDDTVIELMNGSIIRGELVDAGDGQRLYIKTSNGSVIYFTRRAVKEIGSQKPVPTLRNFRTPVTVYLRNGSIITGQLTELQEGGEMKIETPNRSIVYFTERTLKEVVSGGPTQRQKATEPDQQIASSERRTATPRERTTQREQATSPSNRGTQATEKETEEPLLLEKSLPKASGYKGFFDVGYTIKMGDLSSNRIELTTSHGYQINPSLFVGIGLGVNLYSGDGFYKNDTRKAIDDAWSQHQIRIGGHKDLLSAAVDGKMVDSLNISVALPIFADIRYNFTEGTKIIPFAGLKAGYTLGLAKNSYTGEKITGTETSVESLGFYIAPSVGAKYIVSPALALNFTLGYTMQMFNYSAKDITGESIVTASKNNGGISIKIGVEF